MRILTKQTQRGLSLFLAVLMCLSVLPAAAFAADEAAHTHNEDGWTCGQAEAVETLACEEAEHTHGTECYAEDGSLTCGQAEHTHDESCWAVVEGAWTCAAPVEEENSGEEQENEEAAPAITADNAAEAAEYVYGPVSEAYEALLGTELMNRPDVQEAEAVYAAAMEAVDAALNLESGTFDGVTKTDNVTKTAYSQFNPNTGTSNTVSGGFAEDGYGTVVLNGDNPTATDVAFCHYWGAHIAGWPNGFQMIAVEQNTNPKVATATARSSENGLIVEFQKGAQAGTTTICVGFTITTLRPTANIASGGQTYAGFSGYLYYNVTNNGGGTAEPGEKPDKPTVSDIPTANQNGYVYIKCVSYPNSNPLYNSTRTHAGFMSLRKSTEGWSFGEVYANDGRFGSDASAEEYPWLCDLTLDKDWYLATWNRNYSNNEGTHYLADSDPVSMTFVSDGSEWYYFTEAVPLTVWTTHQKPATPTYTVTYTDGVDGEEVFVDQVYPSLTSGTATPAFAAASKGTETLTSGEVQPKRDGYTFMGWTPAVAAAVTETVTYTATWQKVRDLTVTKTPSEEYPVVGEEFSYTIKVENNNATPVTVKVTDRLPAGLDFSRLNEKDGGVYDKASHTVTWENVAVPAYGAKELKIWVKANTAGEICNEAKAEWTGGSSSGNTTVEAKDPEPEIIQVPVTVKVRFVGLDNGTFSSKHAGDGVTATHPNDFYLTTPSSAADNGVLGLSGQWNTLNSHGDGTESGTAYVPYVTFGPEDYYGKWTAEKGKTYTAHFDLSNYAVDGYTCVSANGLANTGSADLTFRADDATPQELVITLCYEKTPTVPEKPDHEEVRGLIGTAVTVICDTEKVSNNTFGYHLNDAQKARVTIGEVVSDGAGGYTCDVTFIAQKFCDAYNNLTSVTKDHDLAENQGNVTLTLTWDAANNAWKLPAGFTAPVTIHVVCQPETPPEPVKPQIRVEKSNGGFQVDPQTGSAAVNYTVKITNISGFDIYGLRLTDTMKPDVTPGDADTTCTFKDWKVDGKSTAPVSGAAADMVHVLQLLPRETLFKDQQTVTLTYTVEIENNGDGEADVVLANTARGASWSKAPASPNPMVRTAVMAVRAAVMPLANDIDDDPPDVTGTGSSSAATDPDAPDVTDEDTSTAGGSTGGSETGGKLPAKYAVIYSWTGLPEGANETLPTEPKRPAGASVTVDTRYTSTTAIEVNGRTYTFSGWSTEDADVEDGRFTMPAKRVTICGEWKDVTPPDEITAAYTVEWYVVGEEKPFRTDSSRTGTVGQEVSVTDSDKKVDGCTFDEKNAANVLTETLAESGTTLKLYFTKDTVIDPEPSQAEYTVEWYVVGEDGPRKTAVRSDEVGKTVSVTDADQAWEGYTFDKDNEGNVLSAALAENGTVLKLYFTKDSAPVQPSEKITVTWLKGYEDDETPVIKTEQIDRNGDYSGLYPANPTRTGYTFAGWSDPVTDADGNITITAAWTPVATPTGPSGSGSPSRPSVNPNPVPAEPDAEIPDEDVPLTGLPDEDVPMAALPEEAPAPAAETEIADEDVPLAEVPQTGDRIAVWYAATALATAAYVALRLITRKREA